MTAAERMQNKGAVPFRLAAHCQDCDMITTAPNNRCGDCGSQSVIALQGSALNREPAVGLAIVCREYFDAKDSGYDVLASAAEDQIRALAMRAGRAY